MQKQKTKITMSLVTLVFFITLLATHAYAWFSTSLFLLGSPSLVAGDSNVIIKQAFVVNDDNQYLNNKTDLSLKKYDSFIRSNNVNTNAILLIELETKNVKDLMIRFNRRSIANNDEEYVRSFPLADVCYVQLAIDSTYSLASDVNLYQAYSRFSNETLYPKHNDLSLGGDNLGPSFTFQTSNFTSATMLLAINFDYHEKKLQTLLETTTTSYSLTSAKVLFINNFSIQLVGTMV